MSLMETGLRAGDGGRDAGPATPLPVARILHWTTAALVLLMAVSGIVMTQLGGGPVADLLFGLHKLTGAVALCLIAARLGYRAQTRLRGRWLAHVANHSVHRILYAVSILVPLLGWAGVSDFGARETLFGIVLPKIWPEGLGWDGWLLSAHAWLAFGMMGLVVAHVAVALRDYVMRGAAGDARRGG